MGCRYHLGLAVHDRLHQLMVVREPWQEWLDGGPEPVGPSCALDVADEAQKLGREEIARIMGVRKAAVEAAEKAGLVKIRARWPGPTQWSSG